MAWTPKSFTPRPRGKPRGRTFTPFKSEGDTKPPKKPRKVKAVDYDDEKAVLDLSQKAAARRMKVAKRDVFSQAKPASDKQRGFLRILLGGFKECNTGTLIRFVEFANQMPSGSGTVDKYDRSRVWLSSIYWNRAIDMAQTGANELCTAMDEVAISMGYQDAFDMETGGLSLPQLPLEWPG